MTKRPIGGAKEKSRMLKRALTFGMFFRKLAQPGFNPEAA
jgi:hypothetical protein